jgi:formate dehydrogenase major subunit
MTQLHGPRSGDLVRARRRHHFQQDLQNSDCIVIMGSNMAENHPVGFQWVMEAKERGAKVIHVDPRFTRTSAMATCTCRSAPAPTSPSSAGSSTTSSRTARVPRVRQALHERAGDHRRGLPRHRGPRRPLLRLGPRGRASTTSTTTTWQYEGMEAAARGRQARAGGRRLGEQAHGAHGRSSGRRAARRGRDAAAPALRLPDPQAPLRALHARDGRESAACRASSSSRSPRRCARTRAASARAFCYAVGWTQHTVGVQYIRAPRSSSCCSATSAGPAAASWRCAATRRSRARPTSRRSTTSCPATSRCRTRSRRPRPRRVRREERARRPAGGATCSTPYMVSLLKAWWGDAATRRTTSASTTCRASTATTRTTRRCCEMLDGKVKGYFVDGREPGRRLGERKLQRKALAKLDWLVVRDSSRSRRRRSGTTRPRSSRASCDRGHRRPRSSSCRRRAHREGRLVHEHAAAAAVAPQGGRAAGRLPLGAVVHYHLGADPREARRLDRPARPADPRPHLGLPDAGPHDEPDAEAVLQEINGRDADGSFVSKLQELKDDGSTACGCWIYCGIYADGVNQPRGEAAHRAELGRARVGLGVAGEPPHPLQPRLGRPRRQAVVGAQEATSGGTPTRGQVDGLDTPDFEPDKPPDYEPARRRRGGWTRSRGDQPFIMQADGRGWLYAPSRPRRRAAARRTTSRTSRRSATRSTRSARTRRASSFPRPENPYNPVRGGEPGADVFPFVLTTYRLTEHHTAGGMSRTVPYLAELQPEMFCEVSPSSPPSAGSSTAAGRRSSPRARRSRRA